MVRGHEFDRKSIHEIEKMTIYDKQAYISRLRQVDDKFERMPG